jgi:thiamine phosphate synthase YjbQ (UPF0047 family)
MLHKLSIRTNKHQQMINITAQIQAVIEQEKVGEGIGISLLPAHYCCYYY